MNTYVPVRKIIKIVSTQRNPKHDRRTSLQKCSTSATGTRRRYRWNPWLILFIFLSVAIYLYSHRAHYLPAMNGQVFINEIHYDAPPHEKIKSTHHVPHKKKITASLIRKPTTADIIDIKATIKSKTTVNLYKTDYDVMKSRPDLHSSKEPGLDLPLCFRKRPYPKFQIKMKSVNLTQENVYPLVVKGGSYHPPDCKARFKVGIIVPYRDRERNLGTFLYNIHPFLMRQKLDYQIFVIEQAGIGLFNKGRVYNAGFREMLKLGFFHCVVFHDVDLLPLHENIVYSCPTLPRHMCARVNDTEMKKIAPSYKSQSLFGGVVSMTREQFERANGFSNLYFGWGGEDNDMYWRYLLDFSAAVVSEISSYYASGLISKNDTRSRENEILRDRDCILMIHNWRLRAAGYPSVRYNRTIGVYLVLPHISEEANPFRYHLLSRAVERYKSDGLSNSEYYVISTKFRPLCTHIVVDINPRGDNITDLNHEWELKYRQSI